MIPDCDIDEFIGEKAFEDGLYAIAYGLLKIANQLNKLGLNGASTSMGAIEAHAAHIKEGLDGIASSLEQIR